MIVVNTETIPGMKIVELKGLVQGNTVRAKHVGRDIAASFKNFVGGELKGYTELLTESRSEAVAACSRRPKSSAQCGGQRPFCDEQHHGRSPPELYAVRHGGRRSARPEG